MIVPLETRPNAKYANGSGFAVMTAMGRQPTLA